MKCFLFTTVIAVVLGLGASNQAQAQIVYGYTLPTDGGLERSSLALTAYGPQSTKEFYSPLIGTMSETTGSMNTLWSRGSYTSISSPFTGTITESRGTMVTPFGLASYLSYNSPYTGPVNVARLGNGSSTTPITNSNGFTNFNNNALFGRPYGGWNNGGWWNSNNAAHHR